MAYQRTIWSCFITTLPKNPPQMYSNGIRPCDIPFPVQVQPHVCIGHGGERCQLLEDLLPTPFLPNRRFKSCSIQHFWEWTSNRERLKRLPLKKRTFILSPTAPCLHWKWRGMLPTLRISTTLLYHK
jgi:hypothetical protein